MIYKYAPLLGLESIRPNEIFQNAHLNQPHEERVKFFESHQPVYGVGGEFEPEENGMDSMESLVDRTVRFFRFRRRWELRRDFFSQNKEGRFIRLLDFLLALLKCDLFLSNYRGSGDLFELVKFWLFEVHF